MGKGSYGRGGLKNAGPWPGWRGRGCLACHRPILWGERCETCKRELVKRRKRKPR
jgi:hypothetical protein